MALLFEAFFHTDTGSSGHLSQGKKHKTTSDLQGAALAPGAKRRRTAATTQNQQESCSWFDVAELSARTPLAEVLHAPPSDHIRLGSDFTGYGTDSLAFHYLGVPYKVAFVAESNHEKDILRAALEKHITSKEPCVKYGDVKNRATTSAPECDVFITGPPCVTFSSLGKRKGASVSTL